MKMVMRMVWVVFLLVAPLVAESAGDGVSATMNVLLAERKPQAFLVDPQGLLSREDFSDQLKFLNYHSSDSAIDLLVVLSAKGESVVDAAVAQAAMEKWFRSGKPVVLLDYVMGEPQRARLFLCPALEKVVTPGEQARALQTSAEQANEESVPARQLEKFLIQLSIRLYWMERQLQLSPEELAASHAKHEEVASPPELSRRELLMAAAKPYFVPAGVGFGLLVIVVLVRLRLKSRAQYRFPNLHVEARLGGPHAAGMGAVVSFAHPSLPASAQKQE